MPTDTIAEEIWKDIPNFTGYQVSDQGRVRSFWKASFEKGWHISETSRRILKPRKQTRLPHYLHVGIRQDGRFVNRVVHLLVMEAFIGPVPDGQEGMHVDSNAWNNNLTNLQYGTHSENMITRSKARAGWNRKLTPETVLQIRECLQYPISQQEIASYFNVTQTVISAIFLKRTWRWVA